MKKILNNLGKVVLAKLIAMTIKGEYDVCKRTIENADIIRRDIKMEGLDAYTTEYGIIVIDKSLGKFCTAMMMAHEMTHLCQMKYRNITDGYITYAEDPDGYFRQPVERQAYIVQLTGALYAYLMII